jgi:hypothetical protein
MYSKKFVARVSILLSITSLIINGTLYSEELVYGSHIIKITIINIEEKEILIPQPNIVTLLFFFNIDHSIHIQILSRLDFLIINLNQPDIKVKLIGISKGEKANFKKIKEKYNILFDLVNDKEEKLFKKFNYTCASCIKIILIDKNSKPRYLSSNFDPIFLRELIQRYAIEVN